MNRGGFLAGFRHNLAARANYLARNPAPLERAANRAAWAATCLLPLTLLHARAGAEILIAAIDTLFLVHLWATPAARTLRSPFAIAATAWWAWQCLCSALGTGGLPLALAAIRLPLLTLALSTWLLATPRRRHTLWLLLALSAAWIALECWQQILLGTNLFGQPRWPDGALTGPFNKPRAGPALVLLLFPAIVPLMAPGRAPPSLDPPAGPRGPRPHHLRAGMLILLSVATMLLIGQRMPSLLTFLGLILTALLIPQLRLYFVAAIAAGAAVLAAMPRLAPAAYDKLVTHTHDQLADFGQSAYGQIFAHAFAMIRAHPIFGQGFDAFRRACAHAAADDLACNLHPHNYYLEAGTNGGLPLLALFAAMSLAAIARQHRPGYLIAAVLAFWPLATTSALTSMPNGGWIFLLLGAGMVLRSP